MIFTLQGLIERAAEMGYWKITCPVHGRVWTDTGACEWCLKSEEEASWNKSSATPAKRG